MAIYLEKEATDLHDLIKKLYSYSVEDHMWATPTYRDRVCTRLQCAEGAWRSFDDTLEIARTYFSNTSAKELMTALLKVDIKNQYGKRVYIYLTECDEIERINYYFKPLSKIDYHWNAITSARGEESDYTWKELLKEIGIESKEELIKFIYGD